MSKGQFKYDYAEIQRLIDQGNSYRSLNKKLGISFQTLCNAQKKGLIKFPDNNQKRLYDLGVIKHWPHSLKTKEKLSKLMTERIRKNIRFSKMENYKGQWLESSYESKVARELDNNKIKWIRPKSLKWNDNGQIRRYMPDFYLPKYDVYLDPKNDFLITKDRRKIQLTEEYNNVTIIVLNKNELTWSVIFSKI